MTTRATNPAERTGAAHDPEEATMIRTPRIVTTLLALVALTSWTACQSGNTSGDTEEVESRLQEDNGGYDLQAEEPAFGEAAAFENAGLLEAQAEVFDEMTELPEVQTLISGSPNTPSVAPGRRFVLVAVWGQPRLDWTVPSPTDWSGHIATNQGAVVVRRTVRFDSEDAILPRVDPRVLPFRSYTQPHHDGLVVNIYENANADPAVPGAVEIALGSLTPITIPYDNLDGFRMLVTVDNLGNKLFIAAEEIPRNGCAAGFLLGRWHRLAPGVGILIGQWAGPAGGLQGHLAGVYGVKPDTGEQVFFGKYIGLGGQARGVLAGEYHDGHFGGLWLGAQGPEGLLGGVYHDAIPGPESGGFFLGGWVQTHCSAE